MFLTTNFSAGLGYGLYAVLGNIIDGSNAYIAGRLIGAGDQGSLYFILYSTVFVACGIMCWILVFFLEKDMSFIERPSSQIIETKLDDLVLASICGVFNGDEETRESDEDEGRPSDNDNDVVIPMDQRKTPPEELASMSENSVKEIVSTPSRKDLQESQRNAMANFISSSSARNWDELVESVREKNERTSLSEIDLASDPGNHHSRDQAYSINIAIKEGKSISDAAGPTSPPSLSSRWKNGANYSPSKLGSNTNKQPRGDIPQSPDEHAARLKEIMNKREKKRESEEDKDAK